MSKTRYILITSVLTTLLVGSSAAAAETRRPNVASTTEAARERGLEQKQSAETRKLSTTTIKAKLDEQRQKQIRSYGENMVKVLKAAIERLTNIADRIGTRLDKLASQGASVTASREKLSNARVKIAEAKTAVDGITAAIETMLVSGDPKTSFENVKALIKTAQEKIRVAHAALTDTINSIKPGTVRATTTPSDSN